jgi:cytochrome c2
MSGWAITRVTMLGAALLSVPAFASAAAAHGPGQHAHPPTTEQIAAGDPGRGAETFGQVCSACHTIEQGARRRIGPNLFGVVGARIAQKSSYPYTQAFREADITWDAETLAEFLAAPASVVPGTKMDWALKDTQAIADVIAYMRGFMPKGAPK